MHLSARQREKLPARPKVGEIAYERAGEVILGLDTVTSSSPVYRAAPHFPSLAALPSAQPTGNDGQRDLTRAERSESPLAAMLLSMASPSPEATDDEVVFTSFRPASTAPLGEVLPARTAVALSEPASVGLVPNGKWSGKRDAKKSATSPLRRHLLRGRSMLPPKPSPQVIAQSLMPHQASLKGPLRFSGVETAMKPQTSTLAVHPTAPTSSEPGLGQLAGTTGATMTAAADASASGNLSGHHHLAPLHSNHGSSYAPFSPDFPVTLPVASTMLPMYSIPEPRSRSPMPINEKIMHRPPVAISDERSTPPPIELSTNPLPQHVEASHAKQTRPPLQISPKRGRRASLTHRRTPLIQPIKRVGRTLRSLPPTARSPKQNAQSARPGISPISRKRRLSAQKRPDSTAGAADASNTSLGSTRQRDGYIPPEYRITGGVGDLSSNEQGRNSWLTATVKVFDTIRRKGGSLVAIDFEGFQQHNAQSVVQTGLVILRWLRAPDGKISESRQYYHLCSTEYASLRLIPPINIGKTEFMPLADIVERVRSLLDTIKQAGSHCLILLHDHHQDTDCLRNIFHVPSEWLEMFGAPSRDPTRASEHEPFRMMDTQHMLCAFARVPFKVGLARACRVAGVRRFGNQHNATNDASFTLQLFLKLCEAVREEQRVRQNPSKPSRSKRKGPPVVIDIDALEAGEDGEESDSEVRQHLVRNTQMPARKREVVDLTEVYDVQAKGGLQLNEHSRINATHEDPILID